MELLWVRDDLRLVDNPALNALLSLKSKDSVAIYIYDSRKFEQSMLAPANKVFLHHRLIKYQKELKEKYNLDLIMFEGDAFKVLSQFIKSNKVDNVFWNRRYFPPLVEEDAKIKKHLIMSSIHCESFNANLLIEPWNGLKDDGKPYLVYSAYFKKAYKKLDYSLTKMKNFMFDRKTKISGHQNKIDLLPKRQWHKTLHASWSADALSTTKKLRKFLKNDVLSYNAKRDRPDLDGTSSMSPYLRFGVISPKMILTELEKVHSKNRWMSDPNLAQYVKELYWREFACQLMYYFPYTVSKPLRPKYKKFPWKPHKQSLRAWQKGLTGYPIVDAGMRQLWATGWMHNRVRMIVASFLIKHLMQPWWKGAEWFAETLVDADIASNSLGWQWVAGSGADAAPYFRIFNPITQGQKFDVTGAYVKKWVPELANLPLKYLHAPWEAPKSVLDECEVILGKDYPEPVVDHPQARVKALNAYSKIKNN